MNFEITGHTFFDRQSSSLCQSLRGYEVIFCLNLSLSLTLETLTIFC